MVLRRAAPRREVTKFSLTQQQVRELSVRRIPVFGGAVKRAKLVERPAEQGGKAYRRATRARGRGRARCSARPNNPAAPMQRSGIQGKLGMLLVLGQDQPASPCRC